MSGKEILPAAISTLDSALRPRGHHRRETCATLNHCYSLRSLPDREGTEGPASGTEGPASGTEGPASGAEGPASGPEAEVAWTGQVQGWWRREVRSERGLGSRFQWDMAIGGEGAG